MNIRLALHLLLLLGLLLTGNAAAAPLGTAFSYQGYLDEGGSSAAGLYDFEFTLWDAATGGAQFGAAVSLGSVPVDKGVFTVQLDFGAGAFNGDARWLQIRTAQTTQPLQLLSPRQSIQAAPYALFALNGGGGGGGYWQLAGTNITNTNAGNVGIGVATPTRKLVVGGEGEFTDRLHVIRALQLYGSTGGLLRASLASAGGNSHAELGLWNNGSDRTAFLTGDENDGGADLTLHNGRTLTVQLDANVIGGGYLGLSRADGTETVQLRADEEDGAAYFRLREGNATRAEISAEGAGTMVLRNDTAIGTIVMDAGDGPSNAGLIQVKAEFGQVGVQLFGDFGDGKGRVVTDVVQILGGADLAEGFDIDAGVHDVIEPGMVVSIDPDRAGKLRVCEQAYDRRVAGIVSGAGGVNPGMVMGQQGSIASGEHPVALTGRVYCLADASNGPIEPGDLLTSSATPGHAMRVDDPARAQGAILGKAMTSLATGRGTVLVLVGLQ